MIEAAAHDEIRPLGGLVRGRRLIYPRRSDREMSNVIRYALSCGLRVETASRRLRNSTNRA